MSIPSTNIYICSGVPLNNRYDHTLYFANAEKQLEYFSGKVVKSYANYTYIRRSWTLKVGATMEEARVWSYLYFRNGGSTKTYFYFVNKVEYINDNTVELTLEMDVLQTYMFDWTINPCYVEREHSVTDNVGENTIDEGLDTGDLYPRMRETIDLSDLCILSAATFDIRAFYTSGGETETRYSSNFGGVFSMFHITVTPATNWEMFGSMINFLDSKGKTDAVSSLWMYPLALVSYTSTEAALCLPVTGLKTLEYKCEPQPLTIGGYTPKNKKLFQYPYCFVYADNNNGGAAVFQYHQFTDNRPAFYVKGNIAPDALIKLIPKGYKGVDEHFEESLALGGFPLCAWASDAYKMWLAQNQNQQSVSLATSALKIVGGTAATVGGVAATVGTGGAGGAVGYAGISTGVGMISSGISDIASQLAMKADKDVQPAQARGTLSGSFNLAHKRHSFTLYHKSIDAQHARVIDDYFTMYGYACRRVKKPNINSRPAFNYVKTIGSNVTGNFCMEDIKTINAIFDRGVTFWKNPAVGNYDLSNKP